MDYISGVVYTLRVPQPASRSRAGAIVAAAIVTVCFWGTAFAAIRAGLHSYSPTHLALLRFLVASGALALYAAVTRMRLPALRDVPVILLLGFLGFSLYNVALNIGERSIPSGPAAVLIQTSPIMSAVAAVLFLKERLRAWGWVGIAVSFSGAAVIGLGGGGDLSLGWGAGLVLLAAVSSTAYVIISKRVLERYRPVELTAYAIWAGALLLVPFSPGLLREVRAAALGDTLAVVFLGVGPAALAYATWSVVLKGLPASRATSILFAVPVTAFLAGWVWLGEAPVLVDIAGGILAIGGVALVNTLGRRSATGTAPRRSNVPTEERPARRKA